MNVLLALAGEAVAIAGAVAAVMWIAGRDEEDGQQRQETTEYSSTQDD